MTKKDETFDKLLDQIRAEKSVSESFASKKHKIWQKQFKLLYNERKKENMVGDEISWTVSDTIISSLQDDKLLHEFEPTEAGDIEACELLNAMMEYDWNKIRMEEVKDLMCQWTVYVGRCVVDCSEISKRTKTISPRFINPFYEFVDPTALCMHGIGEGADGAARWYGYALTTTRGNLENLETEETEGQQAYKNLSNSKEELKDGENMPVTLLVWYTRFNGKCVRVLTDIRVTKILQILPVGKEFPLIDASVGVGREWYPRSTLDMLEDKHRTRASVANTAKELVDEKLTPIAIAKTGFPVHLLEQAESGSIIEAENPEGIRFLEKQSVASEATWLLNMLDQQSQEVTGIPEIQQGVQMDEQRTASELSILSSASKRRYGRTAKWFARAFRKFWEIWYDAYQKYWDDEIHQKVVKISGVY